MVLAQPAYQFSPFAIPPAVTAAVVMLFAMRAVATRFSPTSRAVLYMSVTTAAWLVAFTLMYLATDVRTATFWARVGYGAVPLIAPAVYQFVISVLRVAPQRRIASALGWLVAAQFGVLTLTTNYLVIGVRRFFWGFYPVYDVVASVPWLLFFGGMLTAAALEIAAAYRSAGEAERGRIRWLAAALAVGLVAAVDFLAVYGLTVYPFGWAAVLGYTALAIYAVRREGLAPITPSLAAREIIGTMRDLLLVADRDGRIRFANAAAYAFLGCTREDIIGHRLEEIMAPASPGETSLQGHVEVDREYVFRTKAGQPIELTVSHSPVTMKGKVTGTVLIARDLRDRKRYEWEARRAVTLLQSTLDSTTDGILVMGQEGRVLTWNQRFADIWGIPPEVMEQEQDEDHNLVGQLAEQLINPGEFLRNLEALHDHPEVESFHLLEFKDGRRFEQYSIGRYLGDSPLRVWSFHDMTARLAAEEALRESETRYRLLFEQNAAGVCLVAGGDRIVDCNATFAEMVGCSVGELQNSDFKGVFERASTTEELRRRLEETPTLRGVEIGLRRRDGSPVAALANISLLGREERALVHMTAVDISDRKRAEEQIEFHAYHDALTQLPNRRLFVDRLELSLLTAKRARSSVAVLFLDLDRFKTINDTYGHGVADTLLVEIAQRLRSCVRQTDTVARLGGDEFTVILPDLHVPEDAARVAEKILESIVEPVIVGTVSIEVSVSIGVAVYPFDGTDLDTLLRNADNAMYRAKESGRNTYRLCTEQMRARAAERLSMQTRLRKAMSDDRLVLAYQPQISLATGQLTGAEALIRWDDPDSGTVDPDEFLSIAEGSNLIIPLGEWVLSTACRQLRQWCDSGLPPLRLGVNISARQFQQRSLASVIRRAIDESGIDPKLLELEVGETTAVHHVDVTVELFNLLRTTGVSLAIDDFGSGDSSLRHLQGLPIDAVKIDRHLVRALPGGGTETAIVRSIIEVCRTLGLRVVAEGVESAEQSRFLQQQGCHEAQGAYFSAAVDAEGLRGLIVNGMPLPSPKPADEVSA